MAGHALALRVLGVRLPAQAVAGSHVLVRYPPGLTLRPVRWSYSLPYGIFSRNNPRKEAERFLRFIKTAYTGSDPNAIIPMLIY